MSVRFDAAARRAIDRAMAEAERRGHPTLDTPHLLLGLLETRDAPATVVLAAIGADVESLRAGALRELDGLGEGAGHAAVDESIDRVLSAAHARSVAHRGEMVSDVDIVAAFLDVDDPRVADALRAAGVTPERLDAISRELIVAELAPREGPMTAVADYLSRAEAWTQPTPPPETTITSDRRSYPGLMAVVEPPPRGLTTRVGNGYDSHRFAKGGPLILGGVSIPSDVCLIGHSDGDAVAHAVTDAILGACGAGDIGEMFANTDPTNRGRDSIEMLRGAVGRVHERGWVVQQVDVTVVTERPKIAPYRTAMRIRLAEALGVTADAVSVKGKTNEGMGWIGSGEGLACFAVATLINAPAGD